MTRKKTENQKLKAQTDFLEALAAGATVVDAAKAARVSKSTLYEWKRGDKDFATDWDLCFECGTDALEAEAQRRAMNGVEKPVFHQGMQCGTVREYSDTLLMFLLKARNPYRFCDRTRSAAVMRAWTAEDAAKDGDGSTNANERAIQALERLAAEKAALARRVN